MAQALPTIALALSVAPTGLDSCAIGPPEPVLVATRRPSDFRAAFLKGKIGVIQFTYDQRSLIAAYRVLSGTPLSEREFEAYFPAKPQAVVDPYHRAGVILWEETRRRAVGNAGYSWINTFKSAQKEGFFYYFPNCLDDAFVTATRTLENRAEVWGRESQKIKDWVVAQQQVFANCAGEMEVLPSPPDEQMDPLFAADRRYQIAAAHFYAGNWQKARASFQQIAADRTSPWCGIAPYLSARTYVREGTTENKVDALREAEKRLAAILKDPAQSERHQAAKRLLDYVRLRIDPYKPLAKLAATLMKPAEDENLSQALTDFIYLFNRFSGWNADTSKLAASSDLAKWLLMGRGSKEADVLALWKQNRNPAWLIAALMMVQDDTVLSELLLQARQVRPSAPEYESVVYLACRREAERRRYDAARGWADGALRRPLLPSTRNMILRERLQLARNWTEFLRYAPRRPEPKMALYDNFEIDSPAPGGTASLFDEDVTGLMNDSVPLALWVDASRNPLLPRHLQLQIAQAAWMRAVLLGRHAEGKQLMERIVELEPRFQAPLRDYMAASNPEEMRLAGLLLILRTASLHPALFRKSAALADFLSSRRFGAGAWGFWRQTVSVPTNSARPTFLSAAQHKENESEHAQLEKTAPAGATHLVEQAVKWALDRPDDPRVPEALHLAVQATRRGMKDQRAGAFSRQAFTLLHKRYPKSEWTLKTKYWYR